MSFNPSTESYSLLELHAQLIICPDTRSWSYVEHLQYAQGLYFICPLCYHNNQADDKGVHSIICWFKDRCVPNDLTPGPGRWVPTGSGITDLTLSPSINLSGPGCGWHGWIQNGQAKLR